MTISLVELPRQTRIPAPLVPLHGRVATTRVGANSPQRLLVYGSTGSVGTSTLDLVASRPDDFSIVGLIAGKNIALLVEQAARFRPQYVGVADTRSLPELHGALRAAGVVATCVAGAGEIAALASLPEVDTVIAAIVGTAGLESTFTAAVAGKRILLANKEAVVAAGHLLQKTAFRTGAVILPVDSEHSAIFQLLQSGQHSDLAAIILTASGGPFRDLALDQLWDVTPEQAVKHPNWSMGAKISVDSASMMNKALEVIEAVWLFGLGTDQVEVLIHPQSIVHSLVRLVDGMQLAQLSVPDMRGPIGYALEYPARRFPGSTPHLDLVKTPALEFRALDHERFPAIKLAKNCVDAGAAYAAVFTIANDYVVRAFMEKRIRFPDIVPVVEAAVSKFGGRALDSIEEVYELERELRAEYEDTAFPSGTRLPKVRIPGEKTPA